MTNTSLPPHLERIGRQLTAAAHELSPAPRRSRRRALRLVALSTTGLAVRAPGGVGADAATTATPPAFAVIRHDDGSVSVKINRTTSIAEVNRKLAAMGIERIDKGTVAGDDGLSSIPNCSSIPPGWKGEWVQVPTAGNTGSGNPDATVFWSGAPGTWQLVICTADNPGNAGSGNTGTTGSGNTGAG
jgi:hypothetical protein